MKDDPLLAIQMMTKKQVKKIQRDEMSKRIRVYDRLLESLNSQKLQQQQTKVDGITVNSGGGSGAQLESGMLDELMALGTKVSLVEFRKEIMDKRISASEKLFAIEQEIAVIEGVILTEQELSNNEQETFAKATPALLESTVKKINSNQQLLSRFIKDFSVRRLGVGEDLYSAIDVPYVSNKFGFQLKKTLMILAIAGLMGFAIGCVLALFRTALLNRKEQKRQA